MNLKKLINNLTEEIRKKESVIVAFSGGVDSSVAAALSYRALKNKALAVTINSPLLSRGELANAKKVAKEIGINHLVVTLNELKLKNFVKNPPNRCYICKRFRLKFLKKIAAKKGFNVVIDGTNFNDTGEYRPGLLALKEENVYTPFLEYGLGKMLIRKIAKNLNLSVYNKPPSACLASRFPYGVRLSLDGLKRVDEAESYIKAKLGLNVVRVRDHGELARVEIERKDYKVVLCNKNLDNIIRKLRKLGFKFVTLDLEGYRSGSFDYQLKDKKT
ncbi:MAG: ATP-dependent sacrificial sulfur transferase LarE [Candidatus Bathyarchaeota archaeon]